MLVPIDFYDYIDNNWLDRYSNWLDRYDSSSNSNNITLWVSSISVRISLLRTLICDSSWEPIDAFIESGRDLRDVLISSISFFLLLYCSCCWSFIYITLLLILSKAILLIMIIVMSIKVVLVVVIVVVYLRYF